MKTERLPARNNLPLPSSHSGVRRAFELEPCEDLAPGTLVAGKYRVKDVLGRGGFAVVYDAEHVGLSRDVALKVLHRTEGLPAVLIERFAREARISALVHHPNVLEVHDAGVLEDGSPFLVMEKIAGVTLHQQLCALHTFSVEETLELSSQLLSALVALAARGIVHRDIKPENLMLTRTSGLCSRAEPRASTGVMRLKLVDFGIALVREERVSPRLTQHGALVGTPHYMAPEQLRCEITDVRVDLYATGVVMYQALTGVMPFDGSDLSSLTLNVLNGKARPLRELRPDCPASLARVVERALARAPERRYPDAQRMLADLEVCRAQLRAVPSATSRVGGLLLPRLKQLGRPRQLGLALAAASLVWIGSGHAALAGALRSTLVGVFDEPAAPEPSPAPAPQPSQPLAVSALATLAPGHVATVLVSAEPALTTSTPLATPAASRRRPAATQGSPRIDAADVGRARLLSRKGLTLYLHGELDAAYAVYRQASLLAPGEAAAFRGLGLSASRLGRSYEARRAFARYLELAPEAGDARLIRSRLAALATDSATQAASMRTSQPVHR